MKTTKPLSRKTPPKEPHYPEPGRCMGCGQFVKGGAIICKDCDDVDRREEFESTALAGAW